MEYQNVFANIPEEIPDELIDVLATGEKLRVERIVSRGHASPEDFWYDQDDHEWVMVVQGKGRVEFKVSGEVVEMSAGNWITIPAHCLHRVAWTSPDEDTIWIAVHYK